MKRKNGTGSVVFLGKGRREPYCARITLGYNSNGYPIYHILGTFEEKLDALICLKEYNNHPYDIILSKEKFDTIKLKANLPVNIIYKYTNVEYIDRTNYTFKDVYEEWSKIHYPTEEECLIEKKTHIKAPGKFSRSHKQNYQSAYNKCQPLYNIRYKDLRTSDFQSLINTMTGSSTKINMFKLLFTQLDLYAAEKDIIVKGYAQFVDTLTVIKNNTIPLYECNIDTLQKEEEKTFSYDEIDKLWNSPEILVRDIVLILLYTGMRIEELLFLHNSTINLKENYLISGLKTDNGKNRIIPIHKDIKLIIEKYYKNNKGYFIDTNGRNKVERLAYQTYYRQFNKLMKNLNMTHITHDTRHTLRSELDRLNVNEKIIDLILGHKSDGVGKRVYTHKTIEELKEALNLVTYKKNKNLYVISAS